MDKRIEETLMNLRLQLVRAVDDLDRGFDYINRILKQQEEFNGKTERSRKRNKG